ncbi:MAG: hypothetical protein HOW73_25535 [Polyangiaceae bacterium]|nr:hypothetical protein [Polyangiaceae bacterium]
MGYGLMLYGIDSSALRAALSSPTDALRDAVLPNAIAYPMDPDNLVETVGKALERIARALHPTVISPAHVQWLNDDEAVAFVVTVKTRGKFLGSLEHASRAGEMFRNDFLNGLMSACWGVPNMADIWIARPFYGVLHHGYPSWGGASKAELQAWLSTAKPPPANTDKDLLDWHGVLTNAAQAAVADGLDIVSTYH